MNNANTHLIDDFLKLSPTNNFNTYRLAFSLLLIGVQWSSDTVTIPELQTKFSLLFFTKGREGFGVTNNDCYLAPGINAFLGYTKNTFDYKNAKNQYHTIYNTIDDLYIEYINSNLEKLNEKELLRLLSGMAYGLSNLVYLTLYIETFDYDIALSVLGDGKKEFLDSVWEQATHPYFMSFEVRRTIDLANEIEKHLDINKLLKSVQYIYTDYYAPKTDEEIIREIDSVKQKLQSDPNFINVLLHKHQEESKKYQDYFKDLDEESKKFVAYTQHVMEERDIRKDPIAKVQLVMYKVVEELLIRANIATIHTPNVLAFEALKGIEWLKNNKQNIEDRLNGLVCLLHSNEDFIVESGDFVKLCGEFSQKTKPSLSDLVIKGQSACKGKVVAKARIIYDATKAHDFKEGEILVTSMTRPEFVPLMKQSGGVITNEGGITCHAAIVSRELKIPCIIGTKNATEVIPDGALVELDAEKGIVTIL